LKAVESLLLETPNISNSKPLKHIFFSWYHTYITPWHEYIIPLLLIHIPYPRTLKQNRPRDH
jgi:hypothetical protein